MNFLKLLDITLYPAIAFLVGIMTVNLGHNTNCISISMERLEKVYHPLFLRIEPYLYKNVSYEDVSSFVDYYYALEKEFSLLIHPSLRQEMKYIRNQQEILLDGKYSCGDWPYVCDLISKEYDRLCKRTHIPIRNTAYRLSYKQYRSKISMYFGMFWLNLPAILIFILAFFVLIRHII